MNKNLMEIKIEDGYLKKALTLQLLVNYKIGVHDETTTVDLVIDENHEFFDELSELLKKKEEVKLKSGDLLNSQSIAEEIELQIHKLLREKYRE